jgi:protocatechuate 3,4-dioxygenase beta subunit
MNRFFSLTLLIGILGSVSLLVANDARDHIRLQQIERAIDYLSRQAGQSGIQFADDARAATSAPSDSSFGSAIQGWVSGLNSDSLSRALVVAWSMHPDAAGESTAGFAYVQDNGYYRIEGLGRGEYYVLALADGYYPTFYDNVRNFAEATPVPVFENEPGKEINFYLEPIQEGSAEISGSVSGQFTDQTIAGAQIQVFTLQNPFFSAYARSDENGNYRISGLHPGIYIAGAWADGYITEFYSEAANADEATRIELNAGDVLEHVNFTLLEGGIITGRVVDEAGHPIADAYVQAFPSYGDSTIIWPIYADVTTGIQVPGYGVTDRDGYYRITGLADDEYYVYVNVWNEWTTIVKWYDNVERFEDATPVAVAPGQVVEGIDFTVSIPTRDGVISGLVVDLNGNPIEGVNIQAYSPVYPYFGSLDDSLARPVPWPGEFWGYATTDRNGRYIIENVPTGDYYVLASIYKGWQYIQRWWPDAESQEEAEIVSVTSGVPVTADFTLPVSLGSASVAGYVKDVSGNALQYAYIQVQPAQQIRSTDGNDGVWAWASTDEKGYFEIIDLPAGNYLADAQYWYNQSFGRQWFDHADHVKFATVIRLEDNTRREDINFDLEVRPYYGTIAGSVLDESSGSVIDRAYVEITPTSPEYFDRIAFIPWNYYAITNSNGNYYLEWLPEGDYYVSVYANGAFEYFEDAIVVEQATAVPVVGGQTAAINFGLTPRDEGRGVISGTVRHEYNDWFVDFAIVTATPVVRLLVWPDSEKFYTAITNYEGHYELRGLPEGEYYVMAFGPNYIAEYYDNVFDPSEAEPVHVTADKPAERVDFTLSPAYYYYRADGTVPGPKVHDGNLLSDIQGTVRDASGNPLQNAVVYLLDAAGQPVASARSNKDGLYQLSGIPRGQYRVQAGHLDYTSQYNDGAAAMEDADLVNVAGGTFQVDFALDASVTSVEDPSEVIPATMALRGNYPNPFNPETEIHFDLSQDTAVKLRIFNVLGREVNVLVDGQMQAGEHSVVWNGTDLNGQQMTSGIYFYVLESAGQRVDVKKMTLMR